VITVEVQPLRGGGSVDLGARIGMAWGQKHDNDSIIDFRTKQSKNKETEKQPHFLQDNL